MRGFGLSLTWGKVGYALSCVAAAVILVVAGNASKTVGLIHQLGHFAEAFATYERAKTLDPDNANTTLGAAHLHLLNGDFVSGWAGREARWKVSGLPIVHPKYSAPMWLGQTSIAGSEQIFNALSGEFYASLQNSQADQT